MTSIQPFGKLPPKYMGIFMNKIIFLSVVVGLVGCSSNIEKLVKEQLKDPESAVFKDVKGRCGEVNSKNSYGGYSGFKQFYVSDGVVYFEDSDDNTRLFMLGWEAHCQLNKKVDESKSKECHQNAFFAANALEDKQNGMLADNMKEAFRMAYHTDKKQDIRFDRIVDDVFKTKHKDPDLYGLDVLKNCMAK